MAVQERGGRNLSGTASHVAPADGERGVEGCKLREARVDSCPRRLAHSHPVDDPVDRQEMVEDVDARRGGIHA